MQLEYKETMQCVYNRLLDIEQVKTQSRIPGEYALDFKGNIFVKRKTGVH